MSDIESPGGRLLLLRHGATDWSRDKKHTGRTDIPLNAAGEQQARDLAAAVGGLHPALVLCSPKTRAVRTAELAGLHDPVIDDDLVEWDYGAYEGRTTAEIRQDHPQWTLWTGDPPGGETASQVSARADRVVDRIAAAITEGDVLVVGHGHFHRVIAVRWIGLAAIEGQHFFLDTATICVLGFEHDHRAVLHWNLPAAAIGTVL